MTPRTKLLPAVRKRRKKGVNPNKFLEIMKRLDDIKGEEKELNEKIRFLELEKQYLWNELEPK